MSAILSDDPVYRYRLERSVADAGPVHAYFGVNPSTADHEIDDQTVKKWRGFTKLLGGSRFIVGNFLAFRATDVRALSKAYDPLRTRERRTYSRNHRGDGGLQVRERAATDPAGGRGPAGAIPETALVIANWIWSAHGGQRPELIPRPMLHGREHGRVFRHASAEESSRPNLERKRGRLEQL